MTIHKKIIENNFKKKIKRVYPLIYPDIPHIFLKIFPEITYRHMGHLSREIIPSQKLKVQKGAHTNVFI